MLSYKGVNVVLQRYTSIAFITVAAVCTVSDCTSVLLTPVPLRAGCMPVHDVDKEQNIYVSFSVNHFRKRSKMWRCTV